MQPETLVELTAEIVSAHVENNTVSARELPALIQTIHGALAALGRPAIVEPEQLTPAVPVRSSVRPDALTCLDCGAKFMMLKRHLGTEHSLTPAEYRERWGLKADYPMAAPNYAAKRAELARRIGLGRKPGQKVTSTKATKARVRKASTK